MPRWNAVGFFCEDIRRELNNVDTLVGVMADNLVLDGLGPVEGSGQATFLPKLGIYVRVHLPLDVEADLVSVSADFFEGTQHQVIGTFNRDQIEAEKANTRRNGGPLLGFIIRALLTPFPVPRYGRVLLKVRVGEEEIVCGALNLIPSSTAPPPPA